MNEGDELRPWAKWVKNNPQTSLYILCAAAGLIMWFFAQLLVNKPKNQAEDFETSLTATIPTDNDVLVPKYFIILIIFVVGMLIMYYLHRKHEEEESLRKQHMRDKETKEKTEREVLRKKEQDEREVRERKEAMQRAIRPILRRIKNILYNDPGELYTEKELRSAVGITTVSEDNYFSQALWSLPNDKGYRKKEERVCGTYVRYYYYVDPEE